MGSSTVEVMLSKSAPVFYGDIRNHERVFFYISLHDFVKYEGYALNVTYCSNSVPLIGPVTLFQLYWILQGFFSAEQERSCSLL